MKPKTNHRTPRTPRDDRQGGPPAARNLGWDDDAQAWRFLHIPSGEVFFASVFAVKPGHYEIGGKVYRKG